MQLIIELFTTVHILIIGLFLYYFSAKKGKYIAFIIILIVNTSNLFWLYSTGYYFKISLLILFITVLYYPLFFLLKRNVLLFTLAYLSLEFLFIQYLFPFSCLGNNLSMIGICLGMVKFTGVQGLSLLVIAINLLILSIITKTNKSIKMSMIGIISFLIFLSNWNLKYLPTYELRTLTLNTQLSCIGEKYNMTKDEMLDLYEQKLNIFDSNFDLVIYPENAFDNLGYIESMHENHILKKLSSYATNSIVGAITFSKAAVFNNYRPSGLRVDNMGKRFFFNNTIININEYSDEIEYRHKYYLVPFNEYVPEPIADVFSKQVGYKFFKKPNYNPMVFNNKGIAIGSAICYESLYGTFISALVKNGAQALSFHYNEGWYKSNLGSMKMINQARLRSAETAKYSVGSSNYGFSFIINDKGKVISKEKNDIVGALRTNTYVTFYSKYGNLLGSTAILLLILSTATKIIGKLRSPKVNH